MIDCIFAVVIAALAATPASNGQAAETVGEFVPVNSRTYPLELTGRVTKPMCVDIPEDLSLCQNIGYSQMRMPNLLDHDTMDEVKHQAQSWVPLLLQRCHDDTQLFLCALFAPVCLDRPIYPCRSLCQEVRAGCGPLMESNCFPWPEMLDCGNFPPDNDLCIKSEMREQNGTAATQNFEISSGTANNAMREQYMTLFTQCHDHSSQETLLQKFCTSDFVLKLKIKTIRESKDGKKYIGDSNPDKRQVLKKGTLKNKDLNRLTFYVREGANCRCSMLEHSGNYLLIMGHRDSKKSRKLFMTFVHSWERTREFRRAIKAFESPDSCANLAELIAGGSTGHGESPRRDREESVNIASSPQAADTQDITPDAQQQFPAVQTNTPVNDGVAPADQVMSDETPSPSTRKTGRKRGKKRRRGNQRPDSGPTREIPVTKVRSG